MFTPLASFTGYRINEDVVYDIIYGPIHNSLVNTPPNLRLSRALHPLWF